MPRTPSRVQAEFAWAAGILIPPAAQHRLTSAKISRKGRRLKRGLYPARVRMLMKALGIVTYKIDARARSHVTREHSCARTEPRLMVNLHLVGNYRALVIAHWFDPGDREIPVVEFGQRFLQRGVQVVLKCELCRRGQDAHVHSVDQPVSILGNKLALARCDRGSALRFVMEPAARRDQHEDQNEDDREVVLPSAALVGPEKRPRKNLAKACHVNPRALHRR